MGWDQLTTAEQISYLSNVLSQVIELLEEKKILTMSEVEARIDQEVEKLKAEDTENTKETE